MKVEYAVRGIFILLAVWSLWEAVTTYQNNAQGMISSGIIAAVFATIATAGICKPTDEGKDNG